MKKIMKQCVPSMHSHVHVARMYMWGNGKKSHLFSLKKNIF